MVIHGRMSAASAFPLAVFQIMVKTIEGKTIMLNVTPSMTIAEVMQLIAEKLNAMRWKARLSYSSQTLNDSMCISDYNIQAGSTLFEDGRLRGGSPNGGNIDMEVDIDLTRLADKTIANEAWNRPGVMKMLMMELVKNPPELVKELISQPAVMEALMVGLVNKPLLPDIPNIEDKEVFLFHLM